MLTGIASESILNGETSSFAPVSWQSKRLPRACRSSTSAEIQMASTAIDSHEFMKQLIVDLFNSETVQVQNMDSALRQIQSVIVTHSKTMWGLQLEERRLAVEILSYREGLHAAGIECRWIESDYQSADAWSKAFS